MLNRRDFLKISFAALGGLVFTVAEPAQAAMKLPPILWHGKRTVKAIALTYDDCYKFDELVDLEKLLEGYPDFRVTFFPTGVALQNTSAKDAEIWKRLVAQGHEIGYHSFDHIRPKELSLDGFLDDYARWQKALEKAVGEPYVVKFARPPYGERSYSFLRLCKLQSWVIAMWSVNWGVESDEAVRRVKGLENGDIALLHIRNPDVGSSHAFMPVLKRKHVQVVTLSTLYEISLAPDPPWSCTPYVDQGRQFYCPD